jgi:hypothetical protein
MGFKEIIITPTNKLSRKFKAQNQTIQTNKIKNQTIQTTKNCLPKSLILAILVKT